jgi:hypothetical protein
LRIANAICKDDPKLEYTPQELRNSLKQVKQVFSSNGQHSYEDIMRYFDPDAAKESDAPPMTEI